MSRNAKVVSPVIAPPQYPTYSQYKDSGNKWLGQIPSGWFTKRLIYVSSCNDDVLPEQTDPEYLFKYIDISNVIFPDGVVNMETMRFGQAPSRARRIVKQGDCLVSTVRTYLRAVAHIDFSVEDVIASTGFAILRPNTEIAPSFLKYFVLSDFFIAEVTARSKGVSYPAINSNEMLHIVMPVPEIAEQQAISAFLDRETARIDALINKQQRLITLLHEKRQALISQVVTKGLNPDVPMTNSEVEFLGYIPTAWKLSRLEFETWVRARLGWKGLKAEEYVADGYLFLATPNIKKDEIDFVNVNYITKERYDESPEIKLSVGDVLLAKDGSTLGTVNVIRNLPRQATVNSSIAVITPFRNLDSFYLTYLFSSQYLINAIQRIKGGMGVPHLFQADLNKFTIPLPPLPEQRAIVAFLDSECSKIDTLISKATQAIFLAQERRSALISVAVTGKICVTQATAEVQPLSKSREYFQRVVLGAWIIDQLYKESTFGRVKLQKALHLTEYHAQLPFQHSDYQRYPLGPHDPKSLYSLEAQIKKQKWFSSKSRSNGFGKEYVPMEKCEAYKQYFDRYFTDKLERLQQVISLLRTKDTRFCEVVSTLYGVWNDYLLSKRQPSDEEIINEAQTNWDPKKKEIPEELWPQVLAWMKDHDLIPTGWGEPITHRFEP